MTLDEPVKTVVQDALAALEPIHSGAPLRYAIISTGLAANTYIVDLEEEKVLEKVVRCEWVCDAGETFARVMVTFADGSKMSLGYVGFVASERDGAAAMRE